MISSFGNKGKAERIRVMKKEKNLFVMIASMTILLFVLGTAVIYLNGENLHSVMEHIIWGVIGFGLVRVCICKIPYDKYQKYTPHIFGVALVLQLLLQTPLGVDDLGIRTWIGWNGNHVFRPALFLVVAAILFLAYCVSRWKWDSENLVNDIMKYKLDDEAEITGGRHVWKAFWKRHGLFVISVLLLAVGVKISYYPDTFVYLAAVILVCSFIMPERWTGRLLHFLLLLVIVGVCGFLRDIFGTDYSIGFQLMESEIVWNTETLSGGGWKLAAGVVVCIVVILLVGSIFAVARIAGKRKDVFGMILAAGVGTHLLTAFVIDFLQIFLGLYVSVYGIPFLTFYESMTVVYILEIAIVAVVLLKNGNMCKDNPR